MKGLTLRLQIREVSEPGCLKAVRHFGLFFDSFRFSNQLSRFVQKIGREGYKVDCLCIAPITTLSTESGGAESQSAFAPPNGLRAYCEGD